MPTHLALSDERAAQLRRLAQEKGLTMADALAALINHAIATGFMADELPGFSIYRSGENVVLDVLDVFKEDLTPNAALELADQLDGTVDRDVPHEAFNVDVGFIVGRRGTSIKIRHGYQNGEKTMTKSVAKDVARLLRSAAA